RTRMYGGVRGRGLAAPSYSIYYIRNQSCLLFVVKTSLLPKMKSHYETVAEHALKLSAAGARCIVTL
ncbi:hypothetical protein, partial [Paenibacillus graminis]|uniref:hypothetical protein n=1 Tax=Paenibacillus graminis TaxID=189425 RepID=UPI002DB7C10E